MRLEEKQEKQEKPDRKRNEQGGLYFHDNLSEFRKFANIKLNISKYIRVLILCRYFGIIALGEIKMKFKIF